MPFAISALKVLDFESTRHSPLGGDLTSAVLSSSQGGSLPDRFILCSSTKQGKVDMKSPYLLYGEDDKPWLAFMFEVQNNGLTLWADMRQGSWLQFHSVDKKPWTNVWMHICADVDTTTGTLSVSLNGRPALNRTTKLLQGGNKPNFLRGKLEIGVSRMEEGFGGTRQFFGSVTNVNIFFNNSKKSIEDMSRSPCSNVGDYMSWANADFELNGPMSDKIERDNGRPCEMSTNTVYSLLLPTEMTWTEARHKCNTLGKGNMTDINNDDDLQHIVMWVKETRRSCEAIWTPINDNAEEGVFLNSNTGTVEPFIPFQYGQPNGGMSENGVALFLANFAYRDQSEVHQRCASCNLKLSTTFRLRGLCKSSHMGKCKGCHSKNSFFTSPVWG
jgi:hypothetical protein